MSDFRQFWVGLNMVKGIGAVRLRALLDTFGDAQSAWQASPKALKAAGLSIKIVDNLVKLRGCVSLDEVWERLQKQNIQVLTWKDEAYPIRLREIENAPPVLYIRGSIGSEDEWAVAVVGTR